MVNCILNQYNCLLAVSPTTVIVPASANDVKRETPFTFVPKFVCSLPPSLTLKDTLEKPWTVWKKQQFKVTLQYINT